MELTSSLLKQQIFAYEKIMELITAELEGTSSDAKKIATAKKAKYKSFIENFGLMVYNNGLISALTVAKTKQKEHPVYQHIKEWLKADNYAMGFNYGNDDLLKKLLSNEVNSQKLMLLTQEVLSLSGTLKSFAKAEL